MENDKLKRFRSYEKMRIEIGTQVEWMLESQQNSLSAIASIEEENERIKTMMARFLQVFSDKLTNDELSYIIYGIRGKLDEWKK